MTDAEIAEVTTAAMSNFLTTFSVFLSIATAYLAAAYLVGKKLNLLQLSIVNGSYLIATSVLGYLVWANFRVFYLYASLDSAGSMAQFDNRPTLIDFSWPITSLLIIIVAGSFTFMHSVRKAGSDERNK